MEMETTGWRDIESFDSPEWVRLAAMQALEVAGVTVPSGREEQHVLKQGSGGCFGAMLEATRDRLPYRLESGEGVMVQLPRFFVEAVQFLEQNAGCEGIFRKAGSVARQKNLRLAVNAGASLRDCNVHDVASLLKQYLRELPQPLVPSSLSPALDSCLALGEKERERCLLLVCLLLPSAHLQCLRVLMALLSRVACHGAHSLMSAESLAVVMAPNLLQPCREVLSAMDTSIRAHTVVAKMLIENSNLIGRVPTDIVETAQMLSNEASERPEVVLNKSCEGGSGEAVVGRYQKWRKRTASLSGLVNRLKCKSGRAPHTPSSPPLPSGGVGSAALGHVTQVGRVPSIKRKGSQEDLLAKKRPALAPPPSLSRRLLRSPLISHRKRKAILGRRRHTDQAKSPLPSRLPLSQNIFKNSGSVKFDFAANSSRSTECGLDGVATPARVQLVGFSALHKGRRLLGEDTCRTEGGSGDLGATATEQKIPVTMATSHIAVSSVEGPPNGTNLTTDPQREPVSAGEGLQGCDEVAATPCSVISEKQSVYRSQVPVPSITPIRPPVYAKSSTKAPLPPLSTGRNSSAKRMRCDTGETATGSSSAARSRWDAGISSSSSLTQFPSTSFTIKPPGGIRGSQSDHQLGAHTATKLSAGFRVTEGSPFLACAKIPMSLTHASFPLSLPHDRRQDRDLKVDNLTQTPANVCDSGSRKFPPLGSTFKYSFSNPRPIKSKPINSAALHTDGCEDTNEVKGFESNRKSCDSNEATWLDEAGQRLPYSSLALSGRGLQPNSADPHRTTTQVSSAAQLSLALDEAFLQTPCLPLRTSSQRLSLHSPNLLEKISHEIAERHRFSPSTPCLLPDASVQVNDSYKKAVLGNHIALPLATPRSLQFQDASLAEDGASVSGTGERIVEKGDTEAEVSSSDAEEALGSKETAPFSPEPSCSQTTTTEDASDPQGRDSALPDAEIQRPSNAHNHNIQLCHSSINSSGLKRQPLKSLKLSTPIFHHKKQKPEGSSLFGISAPSPRGFSFSLPSPFSRGVTQKETSNCGSHKLSKRAQLYMVSGPGTDCPPPRSRPSSTPHTFQPPLPHTSPSHLPQGSCDKENWCGSGGVRVCPSHTIQVREWVV